MTDFSKRRCEVWSHPDDPAGFRLLCMPPILDGSNTGERDDAYGKGTLVIPADYEHRALILESDPTDPANSKDSVVAFYLPGATLPYFEFFAEESVESFDDKGQATLSISGSCLRSAVNEAIVYPRAPGDPVWLWGQPTLTRNSDLTEGLIADEEFDIWLVATAGTWRVSFNGGSTYTAALDWDENSSTAVKSAIETAFGIEVNVSGSGQWNDPFKIHVVDPGGTNFDIQVDDSSLTGDIFVRFVYDGGETKPTYYTPSQTIDGIPHGVQGEHKVVLDPDDGLPSILVAGNSAFIGTQQVLDGVAGLHGYATVDIKALVYGANFRLGIRTVDEEWLYTVEGFFNADSVYHTLTIPEFAISTIIDTIILRAAVIDDAPPDFLVRNLMFHPGFPGTTAGDIVQLLMAPAVTRGVLGWLLLDSFDVDNDSNDDTWDEDELTFRADPIERMGDHVLGDLGAEGYDYEFDVVRLPTPIGGFTIGAETHALHLWNPGGRSSAAVTTAIVVGSAISSGRVAKRRVAATHVLVEYGSEGDTVEVTLAALAGLPRREDGLRAEYALDEASAIRAGEAYLQTQVDNMLAVQSGLVGNAVVPYRDFDVGSTVPHELGRHAARHDRRVHGISSRLAAGTWTDEVVASTLFAGEEASDELVRRMWVGFERKDRKPRPRPILPQTAGLLGGSPFVVVAAADSSGYWKAAAMFQCGGTADDAVIQAAINYLILRGGGYLIMAPGTYFISASLAITEMTGPLYILGHGARLVAESSIINILNARGKPIINQIKAVEGLEYTPTCVIDGVIFDGDDVAFSTGIVVYGGGIDCHISVTRCEFRRLNGKIIYCDSSNDARFDIENSTFIDMTLDAHGATSPACAGIQFSDGAAQWMVRVSRNHFEDIEIGGDYGALVDLTQPAPAPSICTENFALNCTRAGGGGLVFKGNAVFDNWINGTFTPGDS